MLAYVFRHRPRPGVDAGEYEAGLRGELRDLNLAAVTGAPREPHDSIAGQMAAGWGGLYTLLRGAAELGPAPEFCLVDPAESSPGRERI